MFDSLTAEHPLSTEDFDIQIEKFEKLRTMYATMVKLLRTYVTRMTNLATTQRGWSLPTLAPSPSGFSLTPSLPPLPHPPLPQTDLGTLLSEIGVKETESGLNTKLTSVAESHRAVGRGLESFQPEVEPIASQMETFLEKAIPDTRMTQKRYEDVKYTYLAYCLKVHEMGERQLAAQEKGELLPRMHTGNFEFRHTLRECMRAKEAFRRLRQDLTEKLNVLEAKHTQDIIKQLSDITSALTAFHETSRISAETSEGVSVFVISVI